MCMIVDANVLGQFLLQPQKEDIAPIYQWLQRGWGTIVYSTGGKFKTDLDDRDRERLAQLVRAGQARLIPWNRVSSYETEFKNIRSNDPHILALARASGVGLLYTRDRRLRSDFRNDPAIGGEIYKNHQDANLLTKDICASQ